MCGSSTCASISGVGTLVGAKPAIGASPVAALDTQTVYAALMLSYRARRCSRWSQRCRCHSGFPVLTLLEPTGPVEDRLKDMLCLYMTATCGVSLESCETRLGVQRRVYASSRLGLLGFNRLVSIDRLRCSTTPCTTLCNLLTQVALICLSK
ncbi:hypothetical protein EDB92DRAFT_1863612 [Lactarius akahatsu]|uniref:Uncharacterized protein n=1 Tax=Lactarius akahatsu TaxID=416441 RepID=A0AAD4LHC1_9AGAM|nr:hypothetical protein EDB92DRAFT_1863612 [Lactarius akahatsu]